MKKIFIPLLLGTALALLVFSQQGLFGEMEAVERFRVLSDGFFLPAVLLGGAGLMSWIAGSGQFVALGYVMHRMGAIFRWGYPRPASLTYPDYCERRSKKEQRPVGFLLLSGVLFLLLSLLFSFLCEMKKATGV